MALDGIAVNNILFELNEKLLGGRIDKIYQPRNDELIISIRSIGENFKLLLSANSSHPRAQLTPSAKENPMTPPMFCMVLRKHIAGSKITKIYQPNFERILVFEMDSLNELGDMTTKSLIIEIMGKHSNIILVDDNNKILDSIKHISHLTSSVREVLPGKEYVLPPSQNKFDPLKTNKDEFINVFEEKKALEIQKIIYQSYTGISPAMASEICFIAGLDSSVHSEELSAENIEKIYEGFCTVFNKVVNNNFTPEIVYEPNTHKIVDFFSVATTQYNNFDKKPYDSISLLLQDFYQERDNNYHIKQKAHDMRKLVSSNIERCVKKKEIQIKTKLDNKNMGIWKLKGELINANIYAINSGINTFKALNYYEENSPEIEIALDPTMTPSENAQRYYNKYNKAKRTLVALEVQEKQNNEELEYLESVLISIDTSTDESDLKDIRDELIAEGFIKPKRNDKSKQDKRTKKSKPLYFVSSDGYDIYVGKSNVQNDELTIKFAKSIDLWFHTKNIPGSHVIICAKDENDVIPDSTLLEAANLAAFNSKAKSGTNVPVDYCPRKNVKKPSGSKPGMVIYKNNKTIYITPDEYKIKSMETVKNLTW